MLKRWDTRNYDLELILTIIDSISINIESMNVDRIFGFPKQINTKNNLKICNR